jgi:Sec-independent protein translocase protein TatA
MAILGILALLVFGEQKLPGIMRQAGRIIREVQNTSQSFVREMERAADLNEPPPTPVHAAESPLHTVEPPVHAEEPEEEEKPRS